MTLSFFIYTVYSFRNTLAFRVPFVLGRIIIVIAIILLTSILMVNAPQFSHKKIGEGFFTQLMVFNNQSGKITANNIT